MILNSFLGKFLCLSCLRGTFDKPSPHNCVSGYSKKLTFSRTFKSMLDQNEWNDLSLEEKNILLLEVAMGKSRIKGQPIPNFYSNLDTAFKLLDHLDKIGWKNHLGSYGGGGFGHFNTILVDSRTTREVIGEGKNRCEGICIASLKAFGLIGRRTDLRGFES